MRRARQLILASILLLLPGLAAAGDKDADALVAIADSMGDFVEGKNDGALKKLNDALKSCAGAACEPNTRAQIYVSIAIVQGAGKKESAKATASFESAIREDPKIVPDRQFMTKELIKLFAEAKANVKKGGGGPAPARPPPTKAQLDALAPAIAQLAQKNWSECMGTGIAAMADTEFAQGKLVVAECEDLGGLILEATADAKLASKYADEELNTTVRKQADDLLTKLTNDTPSLVLVIPREIDNPEVTVDGIAIPKDKADKPIPHNPGKAVIEVKGKKGSFPVDFKTTESIDRGERVTVNVTAGTGNTSAVQACLASARTAAELNLCIETGGKGRGLTFKGGFEVTSYNDSTNVDVFTPTGFISAENPTAGWRIGASYTVDVVTNASPDIVATATRRFDEVRNAGTLAAEVKLGPVRAGIDGGVSIEPDYVARTVGAALSSDLVNKQLTPTLAYHLSFDILGRAHTPFATFHRNILTHSIDLGASVVLSPSSLLVIGGTVELEKGDTSKPYRHVPMFSAATAKAIPRGATPELVSSVRVPIDPFEQLPDHRERFAILGRFAHRFESATLRADERFYIDTWGLKASTTDARFLYDVNKRFRVGPHVRFNIQSPVDFWKRAYVATQNGDLWNPPKYRAGDRELGPLFTATVGGGIRYVLTDLLAINVEAEGLYTQFLDTIYVYDRWGFFSATTLEIGLE